MKESKGKRKNANTVKCSETHWPLHSRDECKGKGVEHPAKEGLLPPQGLFFVTLACCNNMSKDFVCERAVQRKTAEPADACTGAATENEKPNWQTSMVAPPSG